MASVLVVEDDDGIAGPVVRTRARLLDDVGDEPADA
jgi:hypothetical protein